MSRYDFQHQDPKVHLHHDQGGATISGTSRRFADTLCKMNSNVPADRITRDPAKVTCKICLRDARFPRAPQVAPVQPLVPYRYRQSWTGRLVLQVAEPVPYNYDPQHDDKPGGWTTRWRDARVEDLPAGVFPGR